MKIIMTESLNSEPSLDQKKLEEIDVVEQDMLRAAAKWKVKDNDELRERIAIIRAGSNLARKLVTEGRLDVATTVHWITPESSESRANREELAQVTKEWKDLLTPLQCNDGRQEVVITVSARGLLKADEIVNGWRLAVSYATEDEFLIQKYREIRAEDGRMERVGSEFRVGIIQYPWLFCAVNGSMHLGETEYSGGALE